MTTGDVMLGEPAPWFRTRSNVNPDFAFDTLGGRYLALIFLPERPEPVSLDALAAILAKPGLFDDVRAAAFLVLPLAEDGEWAPHLGEIRRFYDPEGAIAGKFGLDPAAGAGGDWVGLDPMMRLVVKAPLAEWRLGLVWLERAPPLDSFAGTPVHAPVLIVPYVFEPALCQALIAAYEQHGGETSGFMREVAGKTALLHDPSHKRRQDHLLADPALIQAARARIHRRLAPEVHKAFQFRATRMERHIVACYDAESGGWFRRHRDNTTAGTAHRRFAVTINLNAEAYEGGDLRFPEFGPRTYRAPTGGAVVFSCSLLHEATPVTRGKRYAYLPFLYDEAAARQREENSQHMADGSRYFASEGDDAD